MKRTILTWSLLALAIWTISGCDSQAPISDGSAGALTTMVLEEVDTEPTTATVTELAFGDDGDTFLDAISTAKNEHDSPVSHRYVDVTDSAGLHWQGEALIDGDIQRVFLQQMQSGGADGLLLETAADADISGILAGIDGAPVTDTLPVFPEIRFVRARESGDGVWAFDVTLAYPDTGWEDYADGWHVETPDGEILGTRILLHPHINEQPFTRSLGGVSIPAATTTILIRSHALVNGYGSEPRAVPLDKTTETDLFEVTKYE